MELTDEMVDQQVTAASLALGLAKRLLLLPAEGDTPIPERIGELIEDLEPAYADTLIAALQEKRALLTDDLLFRVVAKEASAQCTWTQAFAQAGDGPAGISHPEYRTAVAALIVANHGFTQFGHAEVLGELLDTRWSMNDRLRIYAEMMTSNMLDRDSFASVLAQLLTDSKFHAPDEAKFAVFHIAFAEAATVAGKLWSHAKITTGAGCRREDHRAEREPAAPPQAPSRNSESHARRVACRGPRQIAQRQVRDIRRSLESGGLWRERRRTEK